LVQYKIKRRFGRPDSYLRREGVLAPLEGGFLLADSGKKGEDAKVT